MAKKFSITGNNNSNNNNTVTTPFTTAGVQKVKLTSVYIYEGALKLRFQNEDNNSATLDLDLASFLKNNLLKGYFNSAVEGNAYADFNLPITTSYITKDGNTVNKGVSYGIQNFIKQQEWKDGKFIDMKSDDGKTISKKENCLESYKRIVKNYKLVLEQVLQALIDEVGLQVVANHPSITKLASDYNDLQKTGAKTDENSDYFLLNALCNGYEEYEAAKDAENKKSYKKDIDKFLLERFNNTELLNYLKETFEEKVGKEVRLMLTFNHYLDKKVTPNVLKSNVIIPIATLINTSPRSQVYGDYKNPITHEVDGVKHTFFANYGMQSIFPIIEDVEMTESEMPLYVEDTLFTKCYLTDYEVKEVTENGEENINDGVDDDMPF